jgi:hypothetical protein
MGVPVSGLEAAGEKTAEALLSAFKRMEATERRKHATVYNYWLSIRRNGELPPIRDLDPLEISDASPCGILVELVDGGEDAEVLHVGEKLRDGVQAKRVSDAPNPSALSCIAGKLGIVTLSRDALAFEDSFEAADGTTRCCVTLLPFSMTGDAVDFVYGLVTVETGVSEVEIVDPIAEEVESADEGPPEAEAAIESVPVDCEPEILETSEALTDESLLEVGLESETALVETDDEPGQAAGSDPGPADAKPGFSSKVFDALAGAKGFFGTVASAEPEPAEDFQPEVAEEAEAEPIAEEPAPVAEDAPPVLEELAPIAHEPAPVADEVEEPAPLAEVPEVAAEMAPVAEEPAPVAHQEAESPQYAVEGSLQSKLTEVRSMADEARAARLRSEALLLEGLSAAYDFALDAENAPEEYLKLVEEKGLKIQLRSPMKPVVKLAFDGYCDEATIKQFESVLGWALKADLPRGSLAERIEAEGGIEAVLDGHKRRSTDGN